uniref:ATPase AAA-type core domain-containing protein n=1 Tax=Florenciella sp. virus SA2 TaxID=3240092 RepID=A0AB39JC17_9VIRU
MNYQIENIDELLIPNKEKFWEFYENCFNANNLNILIHGLQETCKTTIIHLIMKRFLENNPTFDKNQLIFEFNSFDEINLQNINNVLHIFCQKNINANKIVYIDNFDFFSDTNQQFIKYYIDKYNLFKDKNKIFFIIETSNLDKIKDIIKSRFNIYHSIPLKSTEYKQIFINLLNKENIKYEDKCINSIINYSNINISSLKNIIIKSKLLNCNITCDKMNVLCSFINYDIFNTFFFYINNDQTFKAIDILLNMYNNGIDISDIYFNIYEYIKNNDIKELYCIIENICYYINEIYNGNYNKIMLIIFSFEIKEKLKIV